jgi:hypothetical protein
MQHGVGVLEQLFAKSKLDAQVLGQLEQELQFREVPRARALLSEVRRAMIDLGRRVTPSEGAPVSQGGLWDDAATSEMSAEAKLRIPAPVAAPDEVSETTSSMSIEDAYRLLKVTLNATWEEIERSRCQLVHGSHPITLAPFGQLRKSQVVAEAKRVNQAYAVIANHRITWAESPKNSSQTG